MTRHFLTAFPGSRMLMAGAVIATLAACNERPLPAPPSSLPVAVTLTGFVQDTARRPVAGASVVLDMHPGSAVVTSTSGAFTVSGSVPGATEVAVRATRDGYVPATTTLGFAREGLYLPNVVLTLVPAEPLDVSGAYTMEVVAADSCGMLAPIARRRTYDAVVAQYGDLTSFTMSLSGAALSPDPSTLQGRTALNFVSFDMHVAFDVVEGIELVEDMGGSSVTFWGRATANVVPADRVIEADFNGTISYCSETSGPPVCIVAPTECASTSHRVILTRK
jgi:hypothetical protein